MFNFSNPQNLLGNFLLIGALSMCAIFFLRPQLFKKQDIFLIFIFFICAFILISQDRWFNKEILQFNLILLTIPAIYYTFEIYRLRRKN
ncbi:MAG: hypothetical protein HC908_06270 [Calothrix sp. SM1_7_51]|nr:hypothetical protein [Calothrix sp. SM1_7_51]